VLLWGDRCGRARIIDAEGGYVVSTILFVDDHHAFRTVFGEILRVQGYTVLEAGTTADVDHAVAHHTGPVDLLVVEAVLTTTNGVEVAHRLQARYPQLRVLYISEERADELSAHHELPARAPFLQKPFAAEDLCDKVEELLGARIAKPLAPRAARD
jgi:two-component system, cell cycle sensor histidine kinase and response regulator CckA